ncbi:MAG: hypothetical protein IPG51_14080 [Chloroflexi bacterium]|nr:hypothetical protein [Chloroflexota bacterium]
MKKLLKNQKLVVFFLLLLAMVGTVVAGATTIAVDGTPTDWPGDDSATHITHPLPPGTPSTPSCTAFNAGCALIAWDPDEQPDDTSGIRDEFDIEQVWFTNDATTGYFRTDTYDNTFYIGRFTNPSGTSNVDFCIDEDNNPLTGVNVSGCEDVGAECLVELFKNNTADVTVYDLEGSAFAPGTVSVNSRFTEISFPLSTCGLTNATYSVEVFFNNGALDNDDNVPDTGTVDLPVGSGSPTAVSLESFTPAANSTLPVIGFVGFLALAIISLGTFIVRREQKRA